MTKETTVQGLEAVIPQQGGFVRIVDGPKWTLASIGHSEKYDMKNFTALVQHLRTAKQLHFE